MFNILKNTFQNNCQTGSLNNSITTTDFIELQEFDFAMCHGDSAEFNSIYQQYRYCGYWEI